MILQAIRSAFFYIWFFVGTAIIASIVALASLIPPVSKSVARWGAYFWSDTITFGLRFLVGIRYEITGKKNIPDTPVLIASKHQSDMDTVALYKQFNYPSFIAKKQLFDIPLFGRAIKQINTISIDRHAGAKGMVAMMRQAKDFLNSGQSIFIFPEGTRKSPLDEPNYKFGVIKMYLDNDVPLLPVALNTGLYWGRNSLILWPGTAKISILDPIEAGLTSDEITARLRDVLEAESTRLAMDAIDQNITRPIDAELRGRIDRIRAQSS